MQNPESPSKKCANVYMFRFNGFEKDNKMYMKVTHTPLLHRQFDTHLGRWCSIDPEADELPYQSLYCL